MTRPNDRPTPPRNVVLSFRLYATLTRGAHRAVVAGDQAAASLRARVLHRRRSARRDSRSLPGFGLVGIELGVLIASGHGGRVNS